MKNDQKHNAKLCIKQQTSIHINNCNNLNQVKSLLRLMKCDVRSFGLLYLFSNVCYQYRAKSHIHVDASFAK